MRRLTLTLALSGLVLVVPTPADAAVPTCGGLRATIVVKEIGSITIGTKRRDVIVGTSSGDRIEGRGGDDVICGGTGLDELYGGAGDDRLFGGWDLVAPPHEDDGEVIPQRHWGDVLRGGPGNDRLVAGRDPRWDGVNGSTRDTFLWDTAPNGVRVDLARGVATGFGRDTFDARGVAIVTSKYDDVVLGSDGVDRVELGVGRDRMNGRAGDDFIGTDIRWVGGPSADTVYAGPGNDVVTSSSGFDHLEGGLGDDVLTDLGDTSDELLGGRGDDTLYEVMVPRMRTLLLGGDGRDTLTLSPGGTPSGEGRLDLGDGTLRFDTVDVDHRADSVEVVWIHSDRHWTVTGSEGPDEVHASVIENWAGGVDFLGLGGDDRFSGSIYDDTFDGGDGTDTNLGMGEGTDTCTSVEVDVDSSCDVVG